MLDVPINPVAPVLESIHQLLLSNECGIEIVFSGCRLCGDVKNKLTNNRFVSLFVYLLLQPLVDVVSRKISHFLKLLAKSLKTPLFDFKKNLKIISAFWVLQILQTKNRQICEI
jgi:hypothetical protein